MYLNEQVLIIISQWVCKRKRPSRKSSWFPAAERRTEAGEGDEWLHELDL